MAAIPGLAVTRDVDALVVGAGPAGLAAALELRRLGVARAVVVEREPEAGGIPRHAAHTGFGLRDMYRLLSGPRYAARYVRLAERAGVEVRVEATVTGWTGPRTLAVTAPDGLAELRAGVVLLATGCRERPRAARLVPGSRPHGVLTTGALQQAVYLHHQTVGRRAVVVGAEHVSFSAVLTLAHGGATTVAMVTEHARHQTHPALRWLVAARIACPLLTRTRLARIVGRRRVEAVEVTDLADGGTRAIACDTVVFTGDWIPDHELARAGGVTMDPAARAPRVDAALRCSVPGVFAAGNLVHAAESADVAALGGRHAAQGMHAYLESGEWPAATVAVLCAPPLLWASPGAIACPPGPLPRGRFVLRVGEACSGVTLRLEQDGRTLWSKRYRQLVPNRSIEAVVPSLAAVDAAGGPLRFTL